MRSYWFGDVEAGVCTRASGETETLVERLNSISTNPGDFIPLDWTQARECGAVKDRADYLARLREICICMARNGVIESFREKDTESSRWS